MSEERRAWSWRQAFAQSELKPTTKHVLHTLHLFMNAMGESCFPSIQDLMDNSGLDKKTILTHLKIARESGWIAVSQHGYRGKKWKRNEYCARWPERDLTAPASPIDIADDAAQGGGTVPPPETASEAVEMVPEGGGTEGSKVVEEIHHAIENNPVTIPDTSPVEREGAREPCPEFGHGKAETAAWTGEGEEKPSPKSGHGPAISRDALKRRLRKAHGEWPTHLSDSPDTAETEWFKLTEQEREAAADLLGLYCAEVRKSGRTKFCAFAVYLREKRWLRLDEATIARAKGGSAAGEPEGEEALPYGKLWGAQRFAELMKPPDGRMPPPTRFIQTIIDQGGPAAEKELRDRRAKYGWPAVNDLQAKAATYGSRACRVPAKLAPLAENFDKVRVGGPLWDAWRDLHEERGWPWFGAERLPEWVYFPKPMRDYVQADWPAYVAAATDDFEAAHAALIGADKSQEAAE